MQNPGNLLMTVQNKRGATAVIVAICLIMLIGFAALAIDVGYLYTTRNELQNVADASALAGAGYLGSVYANLNYSEQQDKEFTLEEVAGVVNEVAQKNKAAAKNISIINEDIVIGNWNGSSVDPTLTAPDAVQVLARRDSIANNPVSTFFARIFKLLGTDFDTVNVSAIATAALTGSQEVDPGELKVPFSVSENVMLNCTDLITFSPTTDSCAGWHNFGDLANASKMSDNLFGIIQEHHCVSCGINSDGSPRELLSGAEWLEANFDLVQTPDPVVTGEEDGFQAGDQIDHSGGTISSLFTGAVLDTSTDGGNNPDNYGTFTEPSANPKIPAPFQALFDYFRYRDGDEDDSKWTTTVPVYEDLETCINPSGDETILYFVNIEVIMPNPPPDSTVSVYIDCDQSYTPGRGGGGMGPLKGTIPNLVE
jgi:Flp pilus assembly protein TadG